ncbi:MAG: hypothetical protein EP329_10350 [Deltaproteobacteria bacterium]|nr:MAG: hypothetical protein EP329_10350 [Deltaproteobacteria bacterium]
MELVAAAALVALTCVASGCGDAQVTLDERVERVADVTWADGGPPDDVASDTEDDEDSVPVDVVEDTAPDAADADATPDPTDTLAPADTAAPGDTAEGATCQIGSATGMCRHLSECGEDEAPVEGFCAGGPQTRCCLPSALAGCSVDTAPGACLDVAACDAGFAATAGLCPGPSAIRCCAEIGGATSCDPEVRPTPNAGLVEEPGDPGCPAGMVAVTDALCVDRFEAALVSTDAPAAPLSPYHPPETAARAVSLRWAVPQGNISGVQAAAACAAAGKRLCTSPEWLRACQGPAGWTYPYGDTREAGRCNDARAVHPAIERFGTSDAWIWSSLTDACIAQLPAGLALTGEHGGCVSAEGAYDLMGNLHEWVADADGTFRGGFYVDTALNGPGCLYVTTAHGAGHHDYSTGFRCCADRTP